MSSGQLQLSSSSGATTADTPDVESSSDVPSTAAKLVAAHWDPMTSADWKNEKVCATAMVRIKRDIMEMFSEPPSGIYIVPDENDLTVVYAMLTGIFDTPYEGGFFLFVIRFPPQYPIKAPRVRFLTTDNNKVRFNPNWYSSGKVCLSILGTWSGPGWSPAQTLSSVLISIQSLMTEKPYHNEPGFARERTPGDSKRYSECIEHETLRVAVCGILEGKCKEFPPQLIEMAKTFFMEYYDHYVNVCKQNMHLDGKKMTDPFGTDRGKFIYKDLLEKLAVLHEKITKEKADNTAESE